MANQSLYFRFLKVCCGIALSWGCTSQTNLVAQRLGVLSPVTVGQEPALIDTAASPAAALSPVALVSDPFVVSTAEPAAFTPPQTSPLEPNVQPLPEVMKPDLTVTQKDQVTPNVPLPKGPPISQVTFVDEKTQQPITVGLGLESEAALPAPKAFSLQNYISLYRTATGTGYEPYDPAYSYSAGTLPTSVDLRTDMPPMRNQGARNTCTFFAWAGTVGYLEKRAGLFTGGGLSPGFLSWLYQDEIKNYAAFLDTTQVQEFSSIGFVGNLIDSNTPKDVYYI